MRRPVNVCVATPHTADTPTSPQRRNYGFADCAAILDITSAAFPTGLRQDPAIDLPAKDFKPKSDEDRRLQDLCTFASRDWADIQMATLGSGQVHPLVCKSLVRDSRKKKLLGCCAGFAMLRKSRRVRHDVSGYYCVCRFLKDSYEYIVLHPD